MKEGSLGSKLGTALRKQGWTVFKLANNAMQSGLPDYVYWKPGTGIEMFELKAKGTLGAAIAALSPGQESVLASLARTKAGAILVWGDERHAGVARVMGDWKRFKDHVGATNASMTWFVPTSGQKDTIRTLVELIDDPSKGVYDWKE